MSAGGSRLGYILTVCTPGVGFSTPSQPVA